MNMIRGQITLPIGIALAGISFVTSTVSGYFVSQMAIHDKISEARIETQKQIGIVSSKGDVTASQVEDVTKRMDRFENKLDALLISNGVDPRKFK